MVSGGMPPRHGVQLFAASALGMLLSSMVCRWPRHPSRSALAAAAHRRVNQMWILLGPATTSRFNVICKGTSAVPHERVTVFGGSGFLGRQIVQHLAAGGADVRVAVRHPGRMSSRSAASKSGQVSAIYADVWDEASVGPALKGSDAVINTVGHYVERGKATFEAIHGHG